MHELQTESYHIRSNWLFYNTRAVEASLLQSSQITLPDVDEWIKRFAVTNNQEQRRVSEFGTSRAMLHAIHINYHMFRAHAWVAFIIYHKEVVGVDLRENIKSLGSQDHHFFINFPCEYVQPRISFEHNWSPPQANTYKRKDTPGILNSKVHIKTCVGAQSAWVEAPVMAAHSQNSNLKDWKAAVQYSYLDPPTTLSGNLRVVPVCGVSIQRVNNMQKLCAAIEKASQAAHERYNKSRRVETRGKNRCERREFPDRLYLARRDQIDPQAWWNMYTEYEGGRGTGHNPDLSSPDRDIQTEPRFTECRLFDNDGFTTKMFGYESPLVPRQYRTLNTSKNEWRGCDQVDVRMHFFDQKMQKCAWRELIDGVWYYDDIISFMQTLQKIANTLNITDAYIGEHT